MRNCYLALIALLILGPSPVCAETWTSEDGIVSVEVPDPAKFQPMAIPPAPFSIIWKSKDDDEQTVIGVVKFEIPGDARLDQTTMEEGYSTEIGAPVRRLPTRQVSGHEIWTMTADAEVGRCTQSVFRHNSVVYKLMIITQPEGPDGIAINKFLNSLTITAPRGESGPAKTNLTPGMTVNEISAQVGAAGLFLGMGVALYLVFFRKKSPPAAS